MRRLPALLLVCFGLDGAGCGDSLICDGPGCIFSGREWARLQTLAIAKLPPPPQDPTMRDRDPVGAVALGKAFFSDARFSGASTQLDALKRPAAVGRAPAGQPANVSCASCHDLARGGADTESVPGNVSAGAGWTDVNALSVVNAVYQQLYGWNGRADSLWGLTFAVGEGATTMNGNRLHTLHVIIDNYWAAYTNVFGAPPDLVGVLSALPPDGKPGKVAGCDPTNASEPFGDAWDCVPPFEQDEVTRVLVNWAKALAAYMSTLVSSETPFDRFLAEGPGSTAISGAAKRGARLFVGKAGCIDCHATPLFSDGDFHDVGVPQTGDNVPTLADCPAGDKVCDCTGTGSGCLPWGLYDGVQKLSASPVLRTSRWSDDPRDTSRAADVGRPLTDAIKGAWRTPSLRNVALTAPYMHDGVYATLEEVVAHYSRGPDPGAVGTPAVDIKPLLLSADEQSDLVAFLETLSGGLASTPVGPATTTTGGGGAGGSVDGGMGGGGGAGPPPTATNLPCDVQTLLQRRCQPCHGSPPTNGALFPLVTYADLMPRAAEAVLLMSTGTEPRVGVPATTGEIATLQSWIDAGYPMAVCAASNPLPACQGFPPMTPLITNSSSSPFGGTPFGFQGTNIPPPAISTVTSPEGLVQALHVTIGPAGATDPASTYIGFGLPFGRPSCLDASAYNAVTFSIGGNFMGACPISASLVTSEDNSVQYGPAGTCAAGLACVPPSALLGPVSAQPTPTIVCFADMAAGQPLATVDPRALNGVQWLLQLPTDGSLCAADLTVSDVAFVSEPSCPQVP